MGGTGVPKGEENLPQADTPPGRGGAASSPASPRWSADYPVSASSKEAASSGQLTGPGQSGYNRPVRKREAVWKSPGQELARRPLALASFCGGGGTSRARFRAVGSVVRALASHARGHRFKSCTAHFKYETRLVDLLLA